MPITPHHPGSPALPVTTDPTPLELDGGLAELRGDCSRMAPHWRAAPRRTPSPYRRRGSTASGSRPPPRGFWTECRSTATESVRIAESPHPKGGTVRSSAPSHRRVPVKGRERDRYADRRAPPSRVERSDRSDAVSTQRPPEDAPEQHAPDRPRQRRSTIIAASVAVAVLLAGGGGAYWASTAGDGGSAPAAGDPRPCGWTDTAERRRARGSPPANRTPPDAPTSRRASFRTARTPPRAPSPGRGRPRRRRAAGAGPGRAGPGTTGR